MNASDIHLIRESFVHVEPIADAAAQLFATASLNWMRTCDPFFILTSNGKGGC